MPNLAVTLPQAGDEITASWGQAVAAGMNGIQAGSHTVSLAGVNSQTAVVTFPRPFVSAPNVVVSAVVGSGTMYAIADSVSATTVTLRLSRKDEATTTVSARVDWFAIGVLA